MPRPRIEPVLLLSLLGKEQNIWRWSYYGMPLTVLGKLWTPQQKACSCAFVQSHEEHQRSLTNLSSFVTLPEALAPFHSFRVPQKGRSGLQKEFKYFVSFWSPAFITFSATVLLNFFGWTPFCDNRSRHNDNKICRKKTFAHSQLYCRDASQEKHHVWTDLLSAPNAPPPPPSKTQISFLLSSPPSLRQGNAYF